MHLFERCVCVCACVCLQDHLSIWLFRVLRHPQPPPPPRPEPDSTIRDCSVLLFVSISRLHAWSYWWRLCKWSIACWGTHSSWSTASWILMEFCVCVYAFVYHCDCLKYSLSTEGLCVWRGSWNRSDDGLCLQVKPKIFQFIHKPKREKAP